MKLPSSLNSSKSSLSKPVLFVAAIRVEGVTFTFKELIISPIPIKFTVIS